MTRRWAMPSAQTFGIKPIAELLGRYLEGVSVDPFARDSTVATFCNDLNPMTSAEYHMEAVDFLDMLIGQGIRCDVVLLDPPYSITQVKECYQGFGREMTRRDVNGHFSTYNAVKDRVHTLLRDDGIVVSFGWNSIGMGINRGYRQEEILLVCHGGVHYDTIVTVEKKLGTMIGATLDAGNRDVAA
jgi:hypothetical protein